MSKLRRALESERTLADAKVQAHIDLTVVELRAERELRTMADAYERKYTDGQFGQLQLVAQEHRAFHEREHLLYENAIEKASASLLASMAAMQADLDRLRDASNGFLTIDRFEREHRSLAEKTELAISVMAEKQNNAEKFVVREDTKSEVLDKVQQGNRWLIGLLIGNGLTIVALLLHLAKIY